MKKTLTYLFIFFVIVLNSQTQFTVFSPTMLPNAPTKNDYIKVATKVTLKNIGSKIAGTFSFTPAFADPFITNTITVTNWYCDGNIPTPTTVLDTTYLGKLFKANYVLYFKAYYGSSVTNSNCPVTDSSNVYTLTFSVTNVGIKENEALNNVTLYPNPTKNKFNITTTEPINFTLSDVLGREILKEKITSPSKEIDLSEFAIGIYFAIAEINGNKKIIKLVKE